jgi:K+-transporting ATPase KdpF subunit
MIALQTLYGLAGACAIGLLAYLVYALIRAEEF